LKNLDIGHDRRLYLGLVHAHDLEGTKRRIEIARSVIQHDFGVATECGLGRTPREDVDSIFQILKEITVPA
jgi:Fe2+ or Zn2+ uptake regulation protein